VTHTELTTLLNRIIRRITRQLTRYGFSMNAAVSCHAHQRTKLERLCRHVARPPLALERLSVTDDGKLCDALKLRSAK
jgi:hypothetical protein